MLTSHELLDESNLCEHLIDSLYDCTPDCMLIEEEDDRDAMDTADASDALPRLLRLLAGAVEAEPLAAPLLVEFRQQLVAMERLGDTPQRRMFTADTLRALLSKLPPRFTELVERLAKKLSEPTDNSIIEEQPPMLFGDGDDEAPVRGTSRTTRGGQVEFTVFDQGSSAPRKPLTFAAIEAEHQRQFERELDRQTTNKHLYR